MLYDILTGNSDFALSGKRMVDSQNRILKCEM